MSDINKNDFDEQKKNAFEVDSDSVKSVDSDASVETQGTSINNNDVSGTTEPVNSNNYYNSNQQSSPVSTTGGNNTGMYYSQNGNSSDNYYYQPTGASGNGTPTHRRKSKAPLIITCVLIACVALGGIGITIGAATNYKVKTGESSSGNSNSSSERLDVNDSPTPSSMKDGSDELTTVGVVEKVENSCVGITVTVQNNSNSYGTLGGSTSTGEGSGVIMLEDTAKGLTYIVTSAHVIDTANSVFTVTLNDKSTYPATLVGYDSQTDIGVLSIKATGLQVAEFGESDSLKKGQSVIAIGNPGGSASANATTQGIVSVIDRPVSSQIGYSMKCIQHSAQINPGNSGGGLFNMYGQVIGINSSKIASTEYEGMGFAIPSKTVQEVVNDIISTGYVTGRAQLGIQYNRISDYQNYAQLVAAGIPKGAVVIATINEGSAISGTNIQQYDVITAVNGVQLESVDVLTSALSESKPGDTMNLTMARVVDGGRNINTFEVSVILGEAKG